MGLGKWAFGGEAVASGINLTGDRLALLNIDIGCGAKKRDGYVGVDLLEIADVKCDISVDRLPFNDNSVSTLFSSHCLEHIDPNRLEWHVFKEFTRVVAEDGTIELWHPYALHRDAFIFGHTAFLTEELYYHLCDIHQDFWAERFGGRWVLTEVRYVVEPSVLGDLRSRGVDLEFAVNHLQNVVRELGVFITVEKGDVRRRKDAFRRVICSGGRENCVETLSVGPYVPSIMVGVFPDLTIRESVRALSRAVGRRVRRTLISASAGREPTIHTPSAKE